MPRLLLLCLKAVEPVVDVGVKRGIAFADLPLDPLRDMEGDGAGPIGSGGDSIEPGLMTEGVVMLVECNMAGAWLEDKTAKVNEKISRSRRSAEPGVDSTGGIPIMDGVGAIGPIVGAIGAGGELIESGLMPGAIISGGLAIGDVIAIGGGVIIIGGGVIIIGGGVIIIGGDIIIGGMVVEGDIAGAWPEDRTANVREKVSTSMACEKAMTLSDSQRVKIR
ncbi:hypothetical protein POM88_028500 [Heracleum sosnowskyi]|uniref:Uncharacterized protein n=1 Tax=Heracleum sosnowskyi TaxID=360622 RepID=A0AAD8HRY9_9APIA|nr:hypothetical protein POM88_028500 [Heracleum sosnowskyi]